MFLKVYPDNPAPRHISLIVEKLREGGIIIYPTDTIYAIGCDMNNSKAIDKLSQVIGKKRKDAHFSLICYDLTSISEYTVPFEKKVFKAMKNNLPGPYTFILQANNNVPKIFDNNKKTIGIRVPDNNIIRQVVKELGNPLVTASLRDEDSITEYFTDPELIYEKFKKKADIVIDGGYGDNNPSTIIDATEGELKIIREGKGTVEDLI